MRTRILPDGEWHKLEALYSQYHTPLPRPGEVAIYVAEDEGEIVGSWAIHSILFGGLMNVDKSHRGTGIPGALTKAVEENLKSGDSLFTVIADPHAEKLAVENGMVPVEDRLFRKDI